MMDLDETLQALRELKVETGSFACMGCGHENSCGIHGCAILRRAEELLREQGKILAEINGRQIEGNAASLWDPCQGCNTGWATASIAGMSSCHDTCERRAAYLRARQGVENKPLTPEELTAASEEDPMRVWAVCLDEDGTLLLNSGEWELFDGREFFGRDVLDDMSGYGKSFVAFRKIPEEGREDSCITCKYELGRHLNVLG